MFNKKEVAPFELQTKCETCGAYIDKINKVNVQDISAFSYFSAKNSEYYCNTHKKPYMTKYVGSYPVVYYSELQVSEDGTPIGYVKIKEKP